jgi:4-hydroxy-3-methylbut-2-enyl diphosphate reductase
LEIAESFGKKAWLVENAASLPREVFTYSVVGLAAGASTSDRTIDEIESALME